MELAVTKKIPWKVVKSKKKSEKNEKKKSSKDIIATFSDGEEFVYLTEPGNRLNDIYATIKDLPAEKIKEMITTGVIDRQDICNLLTANKNKSTQFLSRGDQKFDYWEKDVMFMPTLTKERELIYIFACSGAGKSYLTKQYAILYKKFNKGNDVFVLSHVKDDPSFEGMIYTHIPIEMDILNSLDLETFRDSLVIFDDTDTPKDKELQKEIDSLKDDIAQRGRHQNISAIFTTHMACNFLRTRVLLSECDKFVIFPGAGGKKQQEYMVCNYGGMPKSFFANLKDYRSRWVMFNVRYPNYVVHQSGVEILS